MKKRILDIKVGDRHRKEMGDLSALAKSIKEIGLMQPVGITEDHVLIFGERRLRACRDILGWSEIEVRVIDMPHIVVGENAENEVRKDFTPSERVAIARAIANEIGNRQGQRMDRELVQDFAEVPKGQKTKEFASKRAGFGNRETYRQAEAVVDRAEPELVEAMDSGKVSVFAAHKAIRETPERQREIAKTGYTAQDAERDRVADVKRKLARQHPGVQVQSIIDATMELAYHPMTPDEFERLATGPGLERFRRAAIPAFAFLKALTEVGNDQKRTG